MISNQEHPEFDVLNDHVDGRLDPKVRMAVSQHLDTCRDCRLEHAKLLELLDTASSVPRSVLPPDDLWQEIRSSIEVGKEVVLPIRSSVAQTVGSARARQEQARPWWAYRAVLGAAALVLVIASSAVTALVLRQSNGSTTLDATVPLAAAAASDEARLLPAGFRRAENEYLRTIADLRSTLQTQRGVLRPETIAAVEHSLSVVDSAIEEARAALLNDPGNGTLVDLLTASYERKLDLLRRAADLGVRT